VAVACYRPVAIAFDGERYVYDVRSTESRVLGLPSQPRRDPRDEMVPVDIAGDRVAGAKQACWEGVPGPGQHRLETTRKQMLLQFLPAEPKSPDRCHLRHTGTAERRDRLWSGHLLCGRMSV
jgi:hypothetical protein